MHRKAVFALAGVFLVVALVVPPVLFILQSENDLDNITIIQNPKGMQTGGNVTTLTPDEVAENHTFTFILAGVIEVVFVALFVVTIYYGIKHTHPEH